MGLVADGPTAADDAPPITSIKSLGAHQLVYYGLHVNENDSIATDAMATQPGSLMLASVGRGDITAFAPPTGNQNAGAYDRVDGPHNYEHYQNSGTALYQKASATTGAGYTLTVSNKPSDEITMAVVEILGGGTVRSVWNQVVQPQKPIPVTSKSITTSGPATLVAFWWGDAPEPQNKTAVPNNGFTVIDSILKEGALVQCAVAVKEVAAAGTYDVTWTATPVQGAQLYLLAIE